MQQNMPYRHHGGAYAPNQNQYGSNMSQDMYRNHSGYPGGNNRNMANKPWTDNNSTNEMMSPYGQHSHSQMMNNPPPQMPVSTMRSPPHATSNMNPAPPQGQQHYRQMQSPAHSPHSWSQAQIPSPGVMHSSRTTPSPLPTHVRSPGHNQPFSPPTAHAMNMQPHPQPPENGQIPQPINSVGSSDTPNPSNPLHSLQKMVMLDQESKTLIPMMGDGSEQYANHCGPHNYVPEDNLNPESKDSMFSTYYNMDENRFESKPGGSNNNPYSTVQQAPNCNFPLPTHHANSEEVQNNQILPNNSANLPDCLQPDQSLLAPQDKNFLPAIAHSQANQNVVQSDSIVPLSECPPHAESAPVFTDQTKAAVSTNSEQALESKPDIASIADSKEIKPPDTPSPSVEKLESSGSKENLCKNENEIASTQNESAEVSDIANSDDMQLDLKHNESPSEKANSDSSINELGDSAQNNKNLDSNPSNVHISKDEKISIVESAKEVLTLNESNQNNDSINNSNVTIKNETLDDSNDPEQSLTMQKSIETSIKEEVSKDENLKKLPPEEKQSPKAAGNSNDSVTLQDDVEKFGNSFAEITQNPVKVVIHRIRKDDTNDSWHVPSNNKNENSVSVVETAKEKKSKSKNPKSPQIVVLSPATSEAKTGDTVDDISVVTVKEEGENDVKMEVVLKRTPSTDSDCVIIKSENNSPNCSTSRNPDKKRGRPAGSKNKIKTSGSVKKKRTKKGKKKFESSNKKPGEVLPKVKKGKVFNGPYVHITGSKDNPSSISVVNVAQKEEEKISKISTKRNFACTANRIKKKPVGHLSTLSPTYDAFNRDKTWLCIFCHKGSHHGGLGDLYGPYYIKDKNYGSTKSSSTPTSSGASSGRSKKRKSDHDDRASKKSRQAAGHSAAETTPVSRNLEKDTSDPDAHLKETWIHEDCAIWCQSISLFGEEIQGLEEAVTEAYENTCCKCSLNGATLGCWGKGCKELFHYSCAKEMGCQMDIENFSLLCPKHQKRSPDHLNRCQ
ncbi:uncharacterized protein CG5098 isoform X2 [Parasteatoda tepidariorum]|nr:uncharacterized protein CG5098 isoform X2 [Parasteatoda tepidariorum]